MTEEEGAPGNPYENPAFVEAQLRLAQNELEQYEAKTRGEIEFRRGVIHALRMLQKREPLLNVAPVDSPPQT